MPPAAGQPSLTVLSGALAGTVFVVDDSVDNILVGADPACRFALPGTGVDPIHARLWIDLDGITVSDANAPRGVYINDERVQGQARLRNGDILWLGAPGADQSVMLQYRIPAAAKPPVILAVDAIQPEPPVLPAPDDLFSEFPPAVTMLPDDAEIEKLLLQPPPDPPPPPAPAVAPAVEPTPSPTPRREPMDRAYGAPFVPSRPWRPGPKVRKDAPLPLIIGLALAAAVAAGAWWFFTRGPAPASAPLAPASTVVEERPSPAPSAVAATIEEEVTIVAPPDPETVPSP